MGGRAPVSSRMVRPSASANRASRGPAASTSAQEGLPRTHVQAMANACLSGARKGKDSQLNVFVPKATVAAHVSNRVHFRK